MQIKCYHFAKFLGNICHLFVWFCKKMHKIDTLIHHITALSDEKMPATVSSVRLCVKPNPPPPSDAVWLVGTDGCHLCDDVQAMYQMIAKRLPLPKLFVLDVMDLDDNVMKLLAPHIPVLIGIDKLLVYPFGVLDVSAWAMGIAND